MISKIQILPLSLILLSLLYSFFLQFNLSKTNNYIENLEEKLALLEAKDEYQNITVDKLICKSIDVINANDLKVVEIGNDDKETFIRLLDDAKPTIQLVGSKNVNRISLIDSKDSESFLNIGDADGSTMPTFFVGNLQSNREWVAADSDDIENPIMILSDKANNSIIQSYILNDAATLQVGNGDFTASIEAGGVNGTKMARFVLSNDYDPLIGLVLESEKDYYLQVDNNDAQHSSSFGRYGDLMGHFDYSDNNDRSLFLGFLDVSNSYELPQVITMEDGEIGYQALLTNATE